MGNMSLKVLQKSLNFLFKNGYEPWTPIQGKKTLVTSKSVNKYYFAVVTMTIALAA